MRTDSTIWFLLGTLGILFGSAFLFTKVLVGVMTPMQVVAWRLTLATLAVLAISAARRDLPTLSRGLLMGGGVLALLDGLLPYVLVANAAPHMTSGTAAVLMSTMPLFTAVFASFSRTEERLSLVRILGLATGFGGVIVLIGGDALDVRNGVGAAHAAVLLASGSYAIAAVYARTLSRTQGVVDVTIIKLALGAAAAVGLSTVIDGPITNVSLTPAEFGALVALGAVSTGLGRLVYLWVIARAGSVRASLVTYIIPISALLLGWIVLGETMDTNMVAGTTLIIAGMIGVISESRIAIRPWSRPVRSEAGKLASM